jgi:predicted phosphoadenosine phosphosulfate sulfurtransferase
MQVEKKLLGQSVLEAARERVAWVFDTFPRIYISFSGGKDSSVMLHLVMDEAIKRNRMVGVLFVDLEGQYCLTIDHIQECYDLYKEHIEPFWICLPIHLRNAVSQFEAQWIAWEPGREEDWIRPAMPALAIHDQSYFPFYQYAMEFEEFVPEFGHWYSQGQLTACFVGIRTDESLNRWRTIAGHGVKFEGRKYTNYIGRTLYNIYPIYDWKVEDIWTFHGKTGKPYNHLYDLMHKAGLTLSQMRICQPYGDDQRRGLWLYHLIEPETWGKIVARVNGANSGALYVQESGNMTGYRNITLPEGHTWESFAHLLLDSLPPKTKEHYINKIAVFLHWHRERNYPDGIPDAMNPKDESKRAVPSWRRVCKAILRNDYFCYEFAMAPQKTGAYERYRRLMEKRRQQWGILS